MPRTLISDTPHQIGQTVTVKGWVNTRRDHGKIIFLDIRDRSGLLQTVVTDKTDAGVEDVVSITGLVKDRPENLVNNKIKTGHIELEAKSINILNKSKPLPFPIDTDGYEIGEEVRLKYRYLDLRRPRLKQNLKLRSAYVQAARDFLFKQDFLEIETPLLTKSTPEGSRDFLVPSRMQPGKFFALPQSPQQYKQLLMTAGMERYFQIAKCLRDEDLRAERGYEHTQIDLELSFTDRDGVIKVVEDMITHAVTAVGGHIVHRPFPVVTYQQAMDQYGADKFDLRTKEQKETNQLAFAWVVDFPFFEKTPDGGWTFSHNPFSMPKPEHLDWLLSKQNIDQIITQQYDLICNGFEVAGGSIRSHRPDILQAVFEVMGYQANEIEQKFGHMLEAFKLGTPPHGGCASGVERMIMMLTGEDYLREVQAFPQTGRGRTSVMDAPSTVSPDQLTELGISLTTITDPDQSVLEQIKSRLDKLAIDYQLTTHEPVVTSEQAAKVRGTNLHQGAKALIMYADRQPIMVVLSGDTKVDTKQFKQVFSIKDLRMAKPEEVEHLTGVKIGAVPPLGSLFNLTTYSDQALATNQTVIFNAGRHDTSIELSYSDFLRVEQPQLGTFVSTT